MTAVSTLRPETVDEIRDVAAALGGAEGPGAPDRLPVLRLIFLALTYQRFWMPTERT